MHAVQQDGWMDRCAELPGGYNFDWLARALALDSLGTLLADSTQVGFVPSRKLPHAMNRKQSRCGAGSISGCRLV